LKIHIDEKLCSGHGRCYSLNPQIVQANDEGYPVQLGQDIEIGPADEGAARNAIANCPEGAISAVPD
jgi:ferredoxin